MPASNFDVYSRYPWKAVPRGSHTFANVPLQIGGRITLWGATNNANGQVFQDFANQIAVDRTFDALYVYHATFHVSDEDAAVYALQMKYADDTETTTTIRYGVHVRDWYLREGYPLELTDPKSKVVWEGDPSRGIVNPPLKLRFYITELPNTKREVEVKSISLISAKGNSAACILAITTGPADLLRVDEPSDK
jgi:hypothetical protein